MSFLRKIKQNFVAKLVLGISMLTLLGLIAIYMIVNTIVHTIIYNDVVEAAQSEQAVYASHIDGWFGLAYQTLDTLAVAVSAIDTERYFTNIAERFVQEYDFIGNVFIGFEDGRQFNGIGFTPGEGWVLHERAWYIGALAAGAGETYIMDTFWSVSGQEVVVGLSTFVPGLGGGIGGVVGYSFTFDYILYRMEQYPVMEGGYLMLIGESGQLISHPESLYALGPDSLDINLRELHGGGFIMDNIADGVHIAQFDHARVGPAYFIATPLESINWILISIMPTEAVAALVADSLSVIMTVFAVFLIVLLATVMFFASYIFKKERQARELTAEAMKREQEVTKRWMVIHETSPIGINFWDKDMNLLGGNKMGYEISGFTRKEDADKTMLAIAPKRQPDGTLSSEKIAKAFETAITEGYYRFEWMHNTLDGKPLPMDAILKRVEYQDDYMIVVYLQDLRPLREADARIRNAESITEVFFNSAPIVMNIWDEDYNFVSTSRQVVEMYGVESEQQYMEKFWELLPEYQPCGTPSGEKAKKYLKQAFSEGSARFEWMNQTLSGEPVPSDVTMVRFERQGKPFVAVYTADLRPLKKEMEKARAADELAQMLIDSSPLIVDVWDDTLRLISTSRQVVEMFGLSDQTEYVERFYDLSPEYQPCGTPSEEKALNLVKQAFDEGSVKFEWIHQTLDGKPFPVDVTLVRYTRQEKNFVAAYTVDLRPIKEAMEKTREAEELNRLIINACPMVVEVWDENDVLIESNHAFVPLLGLSHKEEFVEKYAELSPEYQPCGTPSMEKAAEAIARTKRDGYFHFEWVHKHYGSGELIPFKCTLVSLEQRGKSIVVGFSHDLRPIREFVEKERELERILFEQEMNEKAVAQLHNAFEQTRAMLDSAPFVVTLWNDTYECMDVSEYTLKLFKIKDKKEYMENFNAFSPERQPCGSLSSEMTPMYFEQAFREGSVNFKWTHQTISGEPVSMDITMARFEFSGRPLLVAYAIDIREAEAAMALERNAFELTKKMVDLLPFVMNMYNSKHELISTSEHVVRLFGAQSQQAYLDNWLDFSPKYQPCGTPSDEKAAMYVAEAFKKGISNFKWVHQTINGEPVPMDIVLRRFEHRGEYMLVTHAADLRDIEATAAKAVQAKIESEAKSRFLSRMSHELRTPITAVLGLSEIQLQNPGLLPDVAESFAKIYDSSNLLLNIVNDILDLSRIEAGKMSLTLAEYDIASLISDNTQLHVVRFGDKDIEFNIHIDEGLPRHLIGDAIQLNQIMSNILSNAFKYTESGLVEMSVECHKDEDDYVALVVTIRDTGIGMTREQLDLLFKEEYVRFHERDTRYIPGTGLGLTIVYSLVHMMGGTIEIESEMGKGTKVVVYIPQKITGTEVLGKEMADSLRRFEMSIPFAAKRFRFVPEPMPYGRVLVVDDIDANLHVAKGLLAFYNLNVETCDSGYEAIEKIEQGNVYDIVFMDQMMPGMNGTEAMQAMRSLGYTKPIVVFTANAMIGQAEAFINSGFDGFISKPIQTNHLNAILTKHIRDKQPRSVIEAAKASGNDKRIESDIHNYQNSSELVNKLRLDFAKKYGDICSGISSAIATEDIKTAHRLAHTLKSVAGLIHERSLAEAAERVERILKAGETPDAQQLSILDDELKCVIEDIGEVELLPMDEEAYMSKGEALALLEKIEPLLASRNSASRKMLAELRKIPQSALLCTQIEGFNFKAALETLLKLRTDLGGE